jgi:hypothetical protein
MNTIAFILGGGLLVLVILAKLPGLEHLVRPLIDIVFSLLKVAAENSWSWTIWLMKLLLDSHLDLVRHLAMSAESIDPSVAMREGSE